MIKLYGEVNTIAETDATVLLLGETGVGKDVIARRIHALSLRKNKTFIKVDCGSIPENLIETELFGYVPGSFSGASKHGKAGLVEAASSGTLFLDEIGESNAQIFNIHMMMLEDEDYNGSIEGMIRSEQVNAEYAVARTSDVFAQMLEAMDNEYMRARSADVRDVSNRLLSILTDTPMDFPWVPENSVVCADDLTPSETAALERRNIAALVTAHGSAISHTAILAHSMNIPTVIGIGDEFLANIRPGEQALVDLSLIHI